MRSHALLLERCTDGLNARWSDALIARMRRHIAGCLMGLETDFRRDLGNRSSEIADILASMTDGLCWQSVQQCPDFLAPELVGHFRDRAAIALMQIGGHDDPVISEPDSAETLFSASAAETLHRLTQAGAIWMDVGPDQAPLSADFPAEIMEALVWTVLALMGERIARVAVVETPFLLSIIDEVGKARLARHDEQSGPVALALLFAHQAIAQDMGADQLRWLARNRQILALYALMAQRIAIDLDRLLPVVVEAPEEQLFRLARAADFPREVAVRIVLGRRCVLRGVEDSVLVHYADCYEQIPQAVAMQAIAPFGMSPCFREKWEAVRPWAGDDAG